MDKTWVGVALAIVTVGGAITAGVASGTLPHTLLGILAGAVVAGTAVEVHRARRTR
ncbi:hypothetical protein [Buchananella hordeovulneris]|uniref:hypothetical protein n=1 Tax=Buchananella hordeovulneris TaxID=52770 RepID=UPI00163A77E9|nr:hypothetical protein [Buchananella hordeovulneris]